MSRRLSLALLVAVFTAAAFTGIALATPGVGLTSTTIATGNLGGPVDVKIKTGAWKLELRTKGDSDVTVVENRLVPGGTFGWHGHPGPSLVVVKAGTLRFYTADDPTCSASVYEAGDSFIDPGDTIHIGRNEGSVEAVIITIRVVPDGVAPRIDHVDPGNCAF